MSVPQLEEQRLKFELDLMGDVSEYNAWVGRQVRQLERTVMHEITGLQTEL